MGWDYDASEGEATYHLTLTWGGKLSTALAAFDAFDWEAEPPEPPSSVYLERDDDDPWPGDSDLTADELAYFGFESPQPGRVPGRKLADNSLWLVTAREAAVLADIIDLQKADVDLLTQLEPDYTETLQAVLAEFTAFCREAAEQGGFWAY